QRQRWRGRPRSSHRPGRGATGCDAALRAASAREAAWHRVAVSRRRRGRRACSRAPVMVTTAADTGFDLTLTEEQELAQRAARDFATEKILPRAAEIDDQGELPPELLREMAGLGFMGTYVPERYGGSGLDAVSYVLIIEEINRACASTGVMLCSH